MRNSVTDGSPSFLRVIQSMAAEKGIADSLSREKIFCGRQSRNPSSRNCRLIFVTEAKGKSEEELIAFIREQLEKREPFYTKARHILDVTLMDDYEKIKISVEKIRDLLGV